MVVLLVVAGGVVGGVVAAAVVGGAALAVGALLLKRALFSYVAPRTPPPLSTHILCVCVCVCVCVCCSNKPTNQQTRTPPPVDLVPNAMNVDLAQGATDNPLSVDGGFSGNNELFVDT